MKTFILALKAEPELTEQQMLDGLKLLLKHGSEACASIVDGGDDCDKESEALDVAFALTDPAISPDKVKIAIFTEGGCITGVHANTPNVEVAIGDHDDDALEGDEHETACQELADKLDDEYPHEVY